LALFDNAADGCPFSRNCRNCRAEESKQDAKKDQVKPPPRQQLFQIFSPIMRDLGASNLQKGTVVSGPVEMKMTNNKAPGKQWQIRLGLSEFKVTIEDSTELTLEQVLNYTELIPVSYRRALEVVSEDKKSGLAIYKNLGGAAAHGGQSYLNMIPLKPAHAASVIVHEAGHILEQRARSVEKDILDKWGEAIQADNIDVSNYGNSVKHEDQAEFARLYAFCIDHSMGRGKLRELKELSPARFALWEKMLELSGAKQPQLQGIFGQLSKTLGNDNTENAKITSGPTATEMPVEMKQEKTPGKVWEVALGESKFKVTIEDKAKTSIAEVLAKVEKLPAPYLRCLEVVSEEGKMGLAVYDRLRGGAAGQGTQNGLNIVPRAGVQTLAHEAGHVLEQRARDTDENILWKNSIAKIHDNISVSNYGDGPIHEDQAEFARIYALCLGNGSEQLAKLKATSPYRFALWERMLVLSQAMSAEAAAPAPNVDFDAELEKLRERVEQTKSQIEKLNENLNNAREVINKK
jgi:hypothetical protein